MREITYRQALNEALAEELERGTLATIPVRGLTYQRVIWASHRKGATLSHAASAFVELLRRKRS